MMSWLMKASSKEIVLAGAVCLLLVGAVWSLTAEGNAIKVPQVEEKQEAPPERPKLGPHTLMRGKDWLLIYECSPGYTEASFKKSFRNEEQNLTIYWYVGPCYKA